MLWPTVDGRKINIHRSRVCLGGIRQGRDRSWAAYDCDGAVGHRYAAHRSGRHSDPAVSTDECLADGSGTFALGSRSATLANRACGVPWHLGRRRSHDRGICALLNGAPWLRARDLGTHRPCYSALSSFEGSGAAPWAVGRGCHRRDHGGNGRLRYSGSALSASNRA
jgi:hypothetical protein